MPRRTILTNHQRASLFDLPTDEAVLVSIMSQAPRTWCILADVGIHRTGSGSPSGSVSSAIRGV